MPDVKTAPITGGRSRFNGCGIIIVCIERSTSTITVIQSTGEDHLASRGAFCDQLRAHLCFDSRSLQLDDNAGIN